MLKNIDNWLIIVTYKGSDNEWRQRLEKRAKGQFHKVMITTDIIVIGCEKTMELKSKKLATEKQKDIGTLTNFK